MDQIYEAGWDGAGSSIPEKDDAGLPAFNGRDDVESATERGPDGDLLSGDGDFQEQTDRWDYLPDETASDEERAAFYSEVSKSWTPKDGYRFKMPEELPEDFPYDQAFAEEAGGWFQEAGLHPEAAQKLHDKWVGKMAEQFSAHEEAVFEASQKQAEAAEAAHRSLVKEYGDPGSDGYQNAIAKADRALSTLRTAGVDLTGWFAEKGGLTPVDGNGLQQVTDPVAVKLLAFIHDSAFAEDGLNGLNDGPGGANPFDKDNPNLRAQSDLLERNPLRARQMIVAAGRDPGLFRL